MKKQLCIIIITVVTTALSAQDISNKIEKESFSHNERIEILREADRCIKNATSKAEYKQCEEAEKKARKSLKGKLKNMNISQAKEKILSKIEHRIMKLQEAKNCVNNAQTKDELKECRPNRDKKRKGKPSKNRMGNNG